jgi:hypothetical protein
VLGRSDFGPQDDFFAAGGTSVNAIDALARVARAFGREPDVGQFFQKPVAGTLLGALERGQDEAALMLADAELAADIVPSAPGTALANRRHGPGPADRGHRFSRPRAAGRAAAAD